MEKLPSSYNWETFTTKTFGTFQAVALYYCIRGHTKDKGVYTQGRGTHISGPEGPNLEKVARSVPYF